jgi:hypothetical protein
MERVDYKLVLVEWQDSRQPSGGWRWADEYEEPEPVLCLTVGWLLRETDDALLVVQNLGDVSGERFQASGATEIARRQVVRIGELTSFFAKEGTRGLGPSRRKSGKVNLPKARR